MNSPTWKSVNLPQPMPLGVAGWGLALLRGVALALVVFGGLAILLLLRLVERPIHGLHRPWTPHITVFVCRTAFRVLGLPIQHQGAPMQAPGIIVANHSTWLDIFALNAGGALYFVSKAEVARWPGIGWLARATGTVFVNRDRREAQAQKTVFEERLAAGHHLLLFPEGTSSDGQRVLPFKPTLFAAVFSPDLPGLSVQPVSVVYHPPKGRDARHYGWWGDMDFGPHLLQTLGTWPQGRVEVIWHPPLAVADHPDRKALAAAAEARVRGSHPMGSADPVDQAG